MTRALLVLLFALAPAGLFQASPARAKEATPVPAPGCGPPGGVLLAQAKVAEGRLPAVATIDPATGDVTGWIDLPPVAAAWPTLLPGKALAVAGGRLYLIDAAARTATEIALPDGDATDLAPNPVQSRGTAGERYVLLGSPGFDRALLIDLERATAVSLPALLGATPEAPVFVTYAAVLPGDANVVLWDGRHVWLADAGDLTTARKIDTADFAFAPAFSPDGRELVFSQSAGPGSGSTLVRYDIATGETTELLKRDLALVTLWVPGGRTLLVDARSETGAAAGRVSLLDLGSGKERELLGYSGSLTTVQFDPSGAHALLGVERIDGGEWHVADLAAGTTRQLAGLTGISVQPGLFGTARWALATPQLQPGDALSGPAYRAIDLETGAVSRLLARDPGLEYAPPVLSPNARFAVVTATGPSGGSWLLDAESVRATKLANAPVDAALFSPDGCTLALGTANEGASALELVATDGAVASPAHTVPATRLLAWIAT